MMPRRCQGDAKAMPRRCRVTVGKVGSRVRVATGCGWGGTTLRLAAGGSAFGMHSAGMSAGQWHEGFGYAESGRRKKLETKAQSGCCMHGDEVYGVFPQARDEILVALAGQCGCVSVRVSGESYGLKGGVTTSRVVCFSTALRRLNERQ